MTIIGCLPLVLIVIGFFLFSIVLRVLGGTLELIGATFIWLYESFLNLFRSHKHEVVNPFTGKSNLSGSPRQDSNVRYTPTEKRPKRYDDNDGEYVDYSEV